MKTQPIKICVQVLLFVSILLTLTMLPQPAFAADLCVDTTGAGGCYTTIQAAVDASGAGDTITIHAGTYDSTIDIVGRTNITLVGADAASTILQPTTTLDWNVGTYGTTRQTVLRVVNSTGITIQNLTFDLELVKGNNRFAALLWDSTGSLLGNTFKNNIIPDASGGYTEGSIYLRAPGYTQAARAAIQVTGNTFSDIGRVAILVHDFVNATIDGNEIYRTVDDFGYGIELGSLSSGTIVNNTIYGFDTAAASDNSSSAGIYIENAFTSDVITPITKNVTVDNNEVYGSQWALHIGNEYDGFAGDVDIHAIVSNNNFHNNVDGTILVSDEDKAAGSSVTASFTNNTVINSSGYGYYIYTLGDGNVNVNIEADTLSGHNVGVYLSDAASETSTSTYSVTVENSQITGNTTYGIQNEFAGTTINAASNWWGSSAPVWTSTVSGNVSYIPWCGDAACASLIWSPPDAATLTSPSGSITDTTPDYTWEAVEAATWYYLWINDASGNIFKQWYEASAVCSSGSCSVTPAGLTLSSGAYTWWIQTWNSSGYGPWSAEMTFTIPAPTLPGKAILTDPTGSIFTRTPTYTWEAASDTTWYYLWVNDASGNIFKQWYEASAVCSGSTCSITPTTALSAGDYTWWVRTWGPTGYGPWSDGMDFTVAVPGKADLTAPLGSITDTTPDYTWTAVEGATWYYLWVNGPSGNVIKQWVEAALVCSSSTCTVTPTTTLGSGAHSWWVQTWNPVGYGAWSDRMDFTTP